MQVVGCQLDIVWEDKQANFARIRSLLDGVSIEPGALLVLPEMFATGFSMDVARIAEGEDRPTHRFLRELAVERQCYVMAGVVERDVDGRGRNEAVILTPDGKEIARYTKLHPFSLGGEKHNYHAGSDVLVLDCQEFKLAPFICYDLRFPEIFRCAVARGAQLFVVIASWPRPRDAHWLALLRARAIENQAYVAGINRTGNDPKLEHRGLSLIVGPRGETLAEAGEGEQVITARLALEPLLDYRQQFPFLDDIRTDFCPQ